MTNKISKLFGIKLSKNGKEKIKKWINDEFGSLYLANQQLETDKDVINFINDMLKQENLTISDISDNNYIPIKNVNKETKQVKPFKYCPYCGECIRGD